LLLLYEHALDRKIEDMKFSAIMHGADPKEMEADSPKASKGDMLFGDPKDYKNMSEQDRKDLSDKMKKKFMGWAGAKNG